MYGLPPDLDLSFFVGKRLGQVAFTESVIFFRFDGNVSVALESSFQHQTKQEVDEFRIGVLQSLPVTYSTLMRVVGRSVISASGDDEGSLAIVFDDHQVLRFFEHATPYESYSISNGDDLYVI